MTKKISLLFIYIFVLFLPTAIKSDFVTSQVKKSDEIIVKFKKHSEIVKIKITDEADFYEILNSYNRNPEVEYAEPNYLYHASVIPSDSNFNSQWYLNKIKAPEAWDQIREADDIVIAIIDSGVQVNHPDLKDNIWQNAKEIPGNNIDDDKNGFIDDVNGWDFVNNVADPMPKFNGDYTEAGILHGTIVAGIAAASGNNATGISGVSWKSKIMPLKVLDDKGEGNTNNVVRSIDYAIANKADVINFSFVGFGYSQSLDYAIKRAYDAGIIIVAAAGNEEGGGNGYSLDNTPMYPVCHDGSTRENRIIGVAATDTLDQKASFSSYGFKCVDISAPGQSIFSTVVYSPTNYANGQPFNSYYEGFWSGTSMATPMVSAAIALVEKMNPNLNRGQVVNTVLDAADNINRLNPNHLNQLGKGRLNVKAAIDLAKEALTKRTVKLLIAPFSNYESLVKITDKEGLVENEFNAYSAYRGGVNITSGDINNDGIDEIITGTSPGGGPHVRIFDSKGELKGQFFAFDPGFRGGVSVASCDINNDGVDEIITGAGPGGGPQVRIFDSRGALKSQFFAYNQIFRGGINLACGDVDGDGQNEIVTGTGKGGGPQVRIFRSTGYAKGQFFAYDEKFRGGVRVAIGDIDGGARGDRQEIITAPGLGGGPHIRIFSSQGEVRGQFFAYAPSFTGGVNIASEDIDNDGLADIITGAGIGGTPHVRVFKSTGKVIGSFYAFEDKFNGGVNVAVIKE